jgi:hypothetical protein
MAGSRRTGWLIGSGLAVVFALTVWAGCCSTKWEHADEVDARALWQEHTDRPLRD